VRVQVASDAWDITITPDAPGTKPCVSPPTPQDRICQFLVQAGTRITLTTRFSGTNPFTDRPFSGGPAWFGCDEGPATPNPIRPGDVGPDTTFPNVTTTCALNLDTGRAVCLGTTDPNDSGATWACSMFYAENPRVQIPLGATSLGPTSSGSAQSAAPGSGSIDSPAAAPRFNPCTVITTEDLTRAAKYLKNSTERTWSSGNTEERSKPSFGSCVYQPVDLNTRPMGMVTVSYGENRMSVSEWEAELRRYSDCEALNIGKRAMQCKGREGNVFVYLADGTTLHVLVTKFVSAVGLADGFPDADTSIALARLIASRV
jgi:hypothetical protein